MVPRRWRVESRVRRWLLALPLLLMAGAPARALHDDLDLQLQRLDRWIETRPNDPEPRLRRAELHRRRREWPQAFADLERVAARAPHHPRLPLARARLFLDAGVDDLALEILDELLAARPGCVEGLRLRAEARTRAADLEGALADLDRALPLARPPSPDDVLRRARLARRLGLPSRALAGLDEGLERLGPVASLQLEAIEIEVARGAFDAALARLDELARPAARREHWLARRGDILAAAGRRDGARAAWTEALAAVGRRGPGRRSTPSAVELVARLRGRLSELGSPSPPPLPPRPPRPPPPPPPPSPQR